MFLCIFLKPLGEHKPLEHINVFLITRTPRTGRAPGGPVNHLGAVGNSVSNPLIMMTLTWASSVTFKYLNMSYNIFCFLVSCLSYVVMYKYTFFLSFYIKQCIFRSLYRLEYICDLYYRLLKLILQLCRGRKTNIFWVPT